MTFLNRIRHRNCGMEAVVFLCPIFYFLLSKEGTGQVRVDRPDNLPSFVNHMKGI